MASKPLELPNLTCLDGNHLRPLLSPLRLPGTGSTCPASNTLLLSLEHLFPCESGPVPYTCFDPGQSSAPVKALAPDSRHCISQCRRFGLEFVLQTPHLPRVLASWIYLSAYIMIQTGDRGLEHRDRIIEERRRCPCPTAHSNPTSQPAEDSPCPETACKMTAPTIPTPTILQMVLRGAVGANFFYKHEPNPCKTGSFTNTNKTLSS